MDEQAAARVVLPTIAESIERLCAQMSVASKAVIKAQDDITEIRKRLHKLETKGEY